MNLKDIANQLLDLGKRNRLLNYKDSGLKSVEILNRNYKEIYEGLVNGKDFHFIDTDSIIQKYHKIYDAPEAKVEEYSKLKVYDITKEAIKPNQVVAYKKGYTLDKVFRALMKEYKYSIQEKGINSLFISFGFVNYMEEKISYRAPLLLIPVEFTKNSSGVYKIHAADDDIILNPTLDYYFNTTRHFDIPDYFSEDFEYDSYMESIKAVLPEDVVFEEGMTLGVYSFMKINMYKDLMDHEEEVLKNKNIDCLLGNPSYTESTLDGTCLPVVNCDSSQYQAIEMAMKGKSFCLQGPPGSGKSQTITNIIASLIGNGRHVLFVSEKLQALQVVYENLRRAGLSDFAIELHSSKANKKTFIDALYKTAILPKYSIKKSAEDVQDSYRVTKSYIDSYMTALHTEINSVTPYELFSMYLSSKGEGLSYKISNIDSIGLDTLPNVERALREYTTAMNPLGYDYRETVFYGFKNLDMSYITYDLAKELESSIYYTKKLLGYRNEVNKYLSMDIKNNKEVLSLSDLAHVFDFIDAYNQMKYDSIVFLDKEKNAIVRDKIHAYQEVKYSEEILSTYDKEILDCNLANFHRKLKSFKGAFRVLNKEYRSIRREILSYRDTKAKDKELLQDLKELHIVKEGMKKKATLLSEIQEYIDFANKDNLALIDQELKLMEPFTGMYVKTPKKECIAPLLDQYINYRNYQNEDVSFKKMAKNFDKNVIDFYNAPIFEIDSYLTNLYANKEHIGSYMHVVTAIEKIQSLGFIDFLHEYLKTGKALTDMDGCFHKTFLQNKVFDCLSKEPLFKEFNPNAFKERVSEFNTLDEDILRLNRDYIISINSMKRPDDVLMEGSKFKILAKEANKVRKQKPIRLLLSEIFELACDIKPVFLMSPLSVSTYLDATNTFDCVIFDEASQIFAQDAFGAIYRGKQCIIIGDSKQMPPSNFFGAIMETEEEDYDGELESILDMACSYMPQSSLKWHYRSRSEELITFSNKEFYDNTLITIPQAKIHQKGFGVDFVYLEKGRYNSKTRTNMVEAEAISDMVIEHYQTSDKSLGVVAFSKVQAELIEDLVDKKRAKYPELAKFFGDEIDEPFFVKNLETVQGDERDRIIFSICYGYNEEGKFYQKFGPLNNLGGERRLNVAITRSKYNITVVSSIMAKDIKEGNSDSLGVKLLRDYLDFAQNIEANKNFSDTEDGVILSVKQFLEDSGYEVYTNFGTSKFRIPLAVREKGMESFLAAIMLDMKEENKNTTDQNRLEKLLLERLGWKYFKLYTVGWVRNQKIVEAELMDFLRNTADEESDEVEESFIEETKNSIEDHFPTYQSLDPIKMKTIYEKKGLEAAITELLKVEQPVQEEYLLRRAAEAMGKTRITNVVKTEVKKAIPDGVQPVLGSYWLNIEENCPLRLHSTRMLNEIPMEEMKSGILEIVIVSQGITVDGAYREFLKLLGFSRLTENAKKLLNDAVVYLKLEGKIVQKGESLYA